MSSGSSGARVRAPSPAGIVLWLLILAYIVFFSAYSLQRHATFNTYAADLSYFDQPLWNTLQGRFMERTLQDRQVPRMTDHFEPILVPISLIYLIWNSAGALLVVQTLALALGALPVYWIARRALSSQVRAEGASGVGSESHVEWAALAFPAAYLLFPSLQAANLADFHADPLIVTPLLFALWYALGRRYRPMWAWALVAMLVKENLPALTFMLGFYLMFLDGGPSAAVRLVRRSGGLRVLRQGPWLHGLALMALSLAWLFVAMFLVVGPIARQFYGTSGPVYLSGRYAGLGEEGVGDLLRGALTTLVEPARRDYLAYLFAAVGWLALLAPEYLLLGLPVLVANLFSSYPAQYSGELHYSAPLVPVFVVAAAFGARRLIGLLVSWFALSPARRRDVARAVTLLAALWLLGWSLGAQIERGWTPIGRNFAWPQVTPHHRLLARFAAQIPPDAAVSTTPPLHPHLAHRQRIYQFPIVAGADFVLLDVAGTTDMHPNDVRSSYERLVADEGFAIVDAADGYVLLARAGGGGGKTLPEAFYDFARAGAGQPEHLLDITFGGQVRLAGYDIVDDPKWRLTRVRLYWQASAVLPADTVIAFQALSPAGEVADDTALRPMPALVWYPPQRWLPGETVVTETLPWFLPRVWASVVTVSAGGRALLPAVATSADRDDSGAGEAGNCASESPCIVGERLRLPAWVRRDGRLAPLLAPEHPTAVEARFATGDWAVRLLGYAAPLAVAPGRTFPVTLRWTAEAGPASRDYTVFLHLRDQAGRTVAAGDATPTWFTPWPTSQWTVAGFPGWDAHTLTLPADLAPGRYDLLVGWYHWETSERLRLTAGSQGNLSGGEFVLGPVVVDPWAAPHPDVCCLIASGCCTSLD